MQIVYILGHEHRLHIFLLQAELLEFSDRTMAIIDSLVLCQLDEVVVPLPNGHWILRKEALSEEVHGVCLAEILLGILPEPVVPSERWNAAGRADPCPCEHHDALTSEHELGRLRSCLDLWLILVFFWLLEAASEEICHKCPRHLVTPGFEFRDFGVYLLYGAHCLLCAGNYLLDSNIRRGNGFTLLLTIRVYSCAFHD